MHRTATMCRVLGVSASGYWARQKRPMSVREKSNRALEAQIREIHRWSDGTYGVLRMRAELGARGTHASRKRVARVMRAFGFQGVTRRKGTFTTVRDRDLRPAPDLVLRNFVAQGPNRLWVADITYIPDLGGIPLPRRGAGRVESAGDRLGGGGSSANRAGRGGASPGPLPAAG